MVHARQLKQLRSGNILIDAAPVNMNQRRETVNPYSVLQPWHTIPIKVTRYFTDNQGTILDIANAGLVASGMVQNYPVFVLGEWDRQGGYRIGLNICPAVEPSKPLAIFANGVNGTTNNYITPFSPFNNLQSRLNIGDIVHVFYESTGTYFCWIVYSNPVAPTSAILANLSSTQDDGRLMRLHAHAINFVCNNFRLQLNEAWNFYHVDNIGRFKTNQMPIAAFDSPMQVAPNVLKFEAMFDINQYVGIATYIIPTIDTMTFNIETQIKQ